MFTLGAAYYPDYLPEKSLCRTGDGRIKEVSWHERIKVDYERMLKCHITSVRIGEFSWAFIEPTRGQIDFTRFQYALDEAKSAGVEVILCTPTATPPKWLIDEHPEILPVTRTGYKIPFGTRRHYDVNNEIYREESKRITKCYADALGKHSAVVGWQIDNEFGCHESVGLFTDAARTGFQTWLRSKFKGDINALNDDWFCSFWSQRYADFSQIDLPFVSWADQNPHMELDFRRFSNLQYAKFQRDQCEILRSLSPDRYITHNLMTLFTDLCPWVMAQDLDQIGFDHYQMDTEPHPLTSHWQFALMRSLKNKPFMVLEQQPLQVNWHEVNQRFDYSWLFMWTLQSAFLGARSMHYFSWQQFLGGAEQYHDGIISHDVRIPETWQERTLRSIHAVFKQLSEQFALTEMPRPKHDVACVFDSESLWSHQITSQSNIYSTRRELDFVASMCASNGLGLYLAESINAALSRDTKPRMLVLPGYAFELTAKEKQILDQFMGNGGIVLSLPRTAMKLRNNQMSQMPLSFIDNDDLYLEDFGALTATERDKFSSGDAVFEGELWAEKIKLVFEWTALAQFISGQYCGSPAVIQKVVGKGRHIHLATCAPTSHEFYKWILGVANIHSPLSAPTDAQVIPLTAGGRNFLAAINFTESSQSINLKYACEGTNFTLAENEMLASSTLTTNNTFKIPAHSCMFLRQRS